MSHFKERKEKNCLNCNAEVVGRYCYVCGQENTPPKQTIGHLFSHIFNDVTHFDGKFFSTLGTLILRPGHLTAEYIRGKKISYLDPVRMYIFTSAVFFLVFFKTVGHVDDTYGSHDVNENEKYVESLHDSLLQNYSIKKYDTVLTRQELLQLAKHRDSLGIVTFIGDKVAGITTAHDYDSLQQTLPPEQRDGLLKRNAKRTKFRLNAAQRADPKHFTGKIINYLLHLLPQLLFVSLPIFALLLQLLYRRRKSFYYTDHIFFTIHLYTYTFISLLVIFLLVNFDYPKLHAIARWVNVLLIVGIFVYQYKAMRTFYQQRRAKTIFKFLLLNIMAVFLMLLLMIIFVLFGAITFH